MRTIPYGVRNLNRLMQKTLQTPNNKKVENLQILGYITENEHRIGSNTDEQSTHPICAGSTIHR